MATRYRARRWRTRQQLQRRAARANTIDRAMPVRVQAFGVEFDRSGSRLHYQAMTLLLIRHGETDMNTNRVVQFPDTPLGEHGLRQAERLGQSLRKRSIARVLTSDYARARVTAEHVARHTGAELLVLPRLRERNFGDIRGTSYADLGELDIFAPQFIPPGGESWEVFDRRVDAAWAEVLEHAAAIPGDIAIVTHGLVLRSLFSRTLDVSAHALETDIVVANTAVTLVDREPPWRVRELASVAHLDDVKRDVAPV
jgi:broad specificity phosphatase PhoE